MDVFTFPAHALLIVEERLKGQERGGCACPKECRWMSSHFACLSQPSSSIDRLPASDREEGFRWTCAWSTRVCGGT